MTENVAPGPALPQGPELPRWLAGPRRILAAIGRVELVLAITALIVVVVLSGAQAILRYTVNASLWWAQEVAQLTIVVAYFFGVSYVVKAQQEILIEFLAHKMPLRVQLVMYAFAQLLTIAFSATVLVLIWRFAPALMGMVTPTLQLPDLVRIAPLGIASAMIVLTGFYYLAWALWALSARLDAPSLPALEQTALIATLPPDPNA